MYPFLYTNEVESVGTLCFKALESSNYEVRYTVAQLFAALLCTAMNPPKRYISGKLFNLCVLLLAFLEFFSYHDNVEDFSWLLQHYCSWLCASMNYL